MNADEGSVRISPDRVPCDRCQHSEVLTDERDGIGMTLQQLRKLGTAILVGCGLVSSMTGCQTTVGGQTLPSPHFLKDDVQYFPAGQEFLLTNKVQAIEQYKLDQSAFQGYYIDDTSGDFGADAQ